MEFDDTPEGDLMFGFVGGYAQYERQSIRKRTMTGRRRRAESGIQPSRTFAPYGYHVPTTTDVLRGDYPAEQLGRYIFREPQAPLVREMFGWYADGRFSYAAMAKHLNSQGVSPPRGGRLWRCSSIKAILNNPVYKGEAVHGRHTKRQDETRVGQPHAQTGRPLTSPTRYRLSDDYVIIPCPALVSEDLWDAAQARMRMNLTSQSGNASRIRMLSGLVYCPNCGGGMTFKGQRARKNASDVPAQYCCSAHIKKQRLEGESFCDAKTYRLSETEGAVVSALLQAAEHPEWIEAAQEAYDRAKAAPQEARDPKLELQAVTRALEELKQEETATIMAQISGIKQGASPDAYAEVFAGIVARRKDLENRRGALSRVGRTKKSGGMAPQEGAGRGVFLRDVYKSLTSPFVTQAEKRALVGRVVEKVVCRKDGADIVFLPGLHGEVRAQAALETRLSVLTAWASYLGL